MIAVRTVSPCTREYALFVRQQRLSPTQGIALSYKLHKILAHGHQVTRDFTTIKPVNDLQPHLIFDGVHFSAQLQYLLSLLVQLRVHNQTAYSAASIAFADL